MNVWKATGLNLWSRVVLSFIAGTGPCSFNEVRDFGVKLGKPKATQQSLENLEKLKWITLDPSSRYIIDQSKFTREDKLSSPVEMQRYFKAKFKEVNKQTYSVHPHDFMSLRYLKGEIENDMVVFKNLVTAVIEKHKKDAHVTQVLLLCRSLKKKL
jgi:PIN domain nuclease of toxin-antitoxin system